MGTGLSSLFANYQEWRHDQADMRDVARSDFAPALFFPVVLSLGVGGAIGTGIAEALYNVDHNPLTPTTQAEIVTEQARVEIPEVLTPQTQIKLG